MKHAKFYTVITLIGIIGLMLAYQQGTLQAEAEAQIQPAKIAICNVTKVITNSQKFKNWQTEKQEEIQQISTELQAMQNELEALNKNLQILKPGSVDYQNRVKEFIEKRSQYQAKDTAYQDLWDRQKEDWTASLYQQILAVINEVAVKHGLDLVLATEDLDLADPMRPDIMQTIVTKKILYHPSKLDITNEVLAALDATN